MKKEKKGETQTALFIKSSNRQTIRFCTIFFLYLSVLFIAPFNHYFLKKGIKVFMPLTKKIATSAGWTLNRIGIKNRVEQTTIQNSRFSVKIKNGCNGVYASMIFISALLAYPFNFLPKILGVLLGIIVIQFINFARVIILFFVGIYFPNFFQESHIFFAQGLVISWTIAFWLFWIKRYTS